MATILKRAVKALVIATLAAGWVLYLLPAGSQHEDPGVVEGPHEAQFTIDDNTVAEVGVLVAASVGNSCCGGFSLLSTALHVPSLEVQIVVRNAILSSTSP